ncbi:Beta-lactamase superfamily domain protein [compost metagenome]
MYSSYKMKFLTLNFVLVLWLSSAYSQSHEITVRFIGNCGLSLTDGTTNLYFDFPYKSGAHHYMEYNLSELDSIKSNPVFIYTHRHSDHYSGKLVRKQARKRNGKVYSPRNAKELEKLNTALKDFRIEAFQTKHRFSVNHCSYLLTWHGKRIFISGDTEHAETIASVQNIDWAFVPVWLLTDAIEKEIKLRENIRMFAIYHIGPRDKITTDGTDTQIKLLDKQGEQFTIAY